MRVAHVLESWGRGGTEAYVLGLVRNLTNAENHLVLLRGDDRNLGIAKSSFCSVLKLESLGKSLRSVCAEVDADVVHLHLYSSTLRSLLSLLWGTGRKYRVVVSFHSPLSQWSFRHRLSLRTAVLLADGVVGASRHTYQELKRIRKDVVQASPPILIDVPAPSKEACRSASDAFNIVCVGRLSKEKRWGDLVDALCLLPPESLRKVTCTIYGDGSEHSKLQQRIQDRGLSGRFYLPGFLARAAAMTELSNASLFVLPSQFEGFGMAAVEAMLLGVPVITSNFPASLEYIEQGITGHSFPIGDTQQLARLIDWHIQHPSESSAMGVRGQKACLEQFAPVKIAEIHAKLYAVQS